MTTRSASKRKKASQSSSQKSSQTSSSQSSSSSSLPQHGELLLINEFPTVCDGSWDGRSVRIIGNLAGRDNKTNTITVAYKGHALIVSTSLIEGGDLPKTSATHTQFTYKKNVLWQFIGEIQEISRSNSSASSSSSSSSPSTDSSNSHTRVLKARVATNVEGMNMTLYERALKVQRNFLKELKATESDGSSNKRQRT